HERQMITRRVLQYRVVVNFEQTPRVNEVMLHSTGAGKIHSFHGPAASALRRQLSTGLIGSPVKYVTGTDHARELLTGDAHQPRARWSNETRAANHNFGFAWPLKQGDRSTSQYF